MFPYKSDSGARIPAVGLKEFSAMLDSLLELGVTTPQICEAASFSFAMVVRVALGLSAEAAKVVALVRSGLGSATTLAAVRHLVNAGTAAHILTVGDALEDPDIELQSRPLQKMGVPFTPWSGAADHDAAADLIASSHAALCGLFDVKAEPIPFIAEVSQVLNELRTPIHCVQSPIGINPETGAKLSNPLFASSTLSLGIPLTGLAAGKDYCGRHYLCDISFTEEIYRAKSTGDTGRLFSEQPVVQIFPEEQAS